MTSSLSAASVAVVTRKEPSRVKVVLLASKVAVTPHSFSRFCFRSRQAAKAQPTAWLSLSPCQTNKRLDFHRSKTRTGSRELRGPNPHRVFNGHKTMADPAPRRAISADVRERPLKVTVRSAERYLLYCLVQNQILQKNKAF